jgi:hypothetical protein
VERKRVYIASALLLNAFAIWQLYNFSSDYSARQEIASLLMTPSNQITPDPSPWPTSGPETSIQTKTSTPSPAPNVARESVGKKSNTSITQETNLSQSSDLESYLRQIKTEQKRLEAVVISNDLFSGYTSLSRAQVAEDFRTYFPFYKAAESKYGVPWSLLWIIHIQETNVSRSFDPEASGYLGAMQRSPKYYPDGVAQRAAANWEFLSNLPQRYHHKEGNRTSDFEEIFFAAWKISRDAASIREKQPSLSHEESILQANFSYCAAQHAEERIKQYRAIKNILTQ